MSCPFSQKRNGSADRRPKWPTPPPSSEPPGGPHPPLTPSAPPTAVPVLPTNDHPLVLPPTHPPATNRQRRADHPLARQASFRSVVRLEACCTGCLRGLAPRAPCIATTLARLGAETPHRAVFSRHHWPLKFWGSLTFGDCSRLQFTYTKRHRPNKVRPDKTQNFFLSRRAPTSEVQCSSLRAEPNHASISISIFAADRKSVV